MSNKWLFNSFIFIFAVGFFIPMYESLGVVGYVIAVIIGLVLATLSSFLFVRLTNKFADGQQQLKENVTNIQQGMNKTFQEFENSFVEKYQLSTKELNNYYEQMAATFQKDVNNSKESNQKTNQLITSTFERQQQANEDLSNKVIAIANGFEQEIADTKKFFIDTSAALQKMNQQMVTIADESKQQNKIVTKDLNHFTDEMVHLFETRLEGEFQTLVQTKDHIQEALSGMKRLLTESDKRNDVYLKDIQTNYTGMFDSFYDNQRDFNTKISEYVDRQNHDLLDVLKETKSDLTEVLIEQKQHIEVSVDKFLNVKELLVANSENFAEQINEQKKLTNTAQTFYANNQAEINKATKQMVVIADRADEQVTTVTNDLNSFTTRITDLFNNRLNEEYKALQDTRDTIQQNLESITTYLKDNDTQVKDYLSKIGTSYQDSMGILMDYQKKFNSNFHDHSKKVEEIIEEKLEETSENIEGILSDQKKQTTDFIIELMELQQKMSLSQEGVKQTIADLLVQYNENVQLTKGIQTEIMKLNEQDVDIISKLMGVK